MSDPDDAENLIRPSDAIAVGMICRELTGTLEDDAVAAMRDVRALFDSWPTDRRWEVVESLAGFGAAFAMAAAQHQHKPAIQYVQGVAAAIAGSLAERPER